MMPESATLSRFVLLLAVLGMATSSQADDEATRSALRAQNFPWYDAANDQFRPLTPVKPKEIRSDEGVRGVNLGPPLQLLMWTLLALMIGLGVYLIYRSSLTLGDKIGDRSLMSDAELDIARLEALPEATRRITDLLGHARMLADEGRFGEAMTFFHSWQLMELDKAGVLELQKGKTNLAYLSEVSSGRPELSKLFRLSTRLFEDAYFGHLAVDREDFEQLWQQHARFEAKSRRAGVPA